MFKTDINDSKDYYMFYLQLCHTKQPYYIINPYCFVIQKSIKYFYHKNYLDNIMQIWKIGFQHAH